MAVTWKKLAKEDDVITKALLTAAGDIIYASGASTPAKLAKGANGEVLTLAAGLPSWAAAPGNGGPTIVRKTADETVNNSTTLQNDDHLLLAVAANEIWFISVFFIFNSTSVADLKYAFSLPTGATAQKQHLLSAVATPSDATTATKLSGEGAIRWSRVYVLYIGGANAGNVQLQWAQWLAEASDTQVLTNSFILAWKVA